MKSLIIGGGLSGLALADMLQSQGHDYVLAEARNRLGGRIKTERQAGGYFDMGPAWFWDGQPRIAALIDRLGLEKFDQFAEGLQTFEDERGHVKYERGFSSMLGSWRLKGGLDRITQRLAEGLPDNRKHLNAPISTIAKTEEGIRATLTNGETLDAGRAVLSLPPRIAAQINFAPALPEVTLSKMQSIPTWMAGQAKAMAIYETPFWREKGLSGDAISRHGPMVEIHDASPADGGPYALFGFIGVPPKARQDAQALRHHVLDQLARLFGPQAAHPVRLAIKDWAFDARTATQSDHAPLYAHPRYELPQVMRGLWGGSLFFGGTETAPQFGGYLEGALEAAETLFGLLE